jgi:hypothetical protein
MLDGFELEAVRGCLGKDFPLHELQMDLLRDYVGQALEGQPDSVKEDLEGAVLGVRPFRTDADHAEPFVEFCVDEVPIVRISLSRLLPGAPSPA